MPAGPDVTVASPLRKRYAVIALGNPVLCDDSAALVALRILQETTQSRNVDFVENYASGMDLLPELMDREAVIVIDAIRTLECAPGTCIEVSLEDLDQTRQPRLVDTHGLNLATVVATGHSFGYDMPKRLQILGIEGRDFTSFQETPSPAVMDALPAIVARIERTLLEWEERR